MDTFLSKDRFSKSAPWIGLFLKIDFFEMDILDRSFSTDRLFEIGPLDRSFSKDRFSKSAPWIGLFPQIGFFEIGPLDRSFSKERTFFKIGTFLCDGPIGMVRYVSEVCQVM